MIFSDSYFTETYIVILSLNLLQQIHRYVKYHIFIKKDALSLAKTGVDFCQEVKAVLFCMQ